MKKDEDSEWDIPYSDYIHKKYRYSRQYVRIGEYRQRLVMAVSGIHIGPAVVADVYENGDIDRRVEPISEKWKRPIKQVMDDEKTLKECLRFYFSKRERSKRKRIDEFKRRWDVHIDRFLDTNPSAALLMEHAPTKARVDMTRLLPIHEVMRSGDLFWIDLRYFVLYVSQRMTRYVIEHHPADYVQKTKAGARHTMRFWYHCLFEGSDATQSP